ncbi:Hypothetical protein F387_00772 [Wohlfahrtiimonas chitiniclastica SH04]|uniref:Glycosyltransferase 2-like domain-containing protein n=1 Tax=Wohlfahrtiimonas chitiniclastica SH04 TaxID=1261130 RepID=L8XVK1_9GAMM|nr:glycosyltransferase family 2 protein [Wohlfahrtiimonas chitiniclastica]ELV08043.1 Hypothetical protein F387_00772 [Wohlfahrtiimonas chitiniclastica SH04]
MSTHRPCFVIPCYNHAAELLPLMPDLVAFDLPIIVVNDGSDADNTARLQAIADEYAIHLHHHTHNQGKGQAMITGLEMADQLGFTHAIQIDSDGQHQLADVPKFLARSEAEPDAVISGQPVYDASIPKGRLYARYITHFWVWVETLSFDIKDSMCGFRVYPVGMTLYVIENSKMGVHMDFDIEILVRLHWQHVPMIFIQTEVIYPEHGISHFRMLKDNVLISWMHTRLVFGMLKRLPCLLRRKLHG